MGRRVEENTARTTNLKVNRNEDKKQNSKRKNKGKGRRGRGKRITDQSKKRTRGGGDENSIW